MSDAGETSGGKTKPVVYALSRASRCYSCDKKLVPGDITKLEHASEDREVLCQNCAGLDKLEVLLSGNAKVTRLASKYSSVKFTVVRWSALWKTYERVGLLLEPEAIAKARQECGAS
jgi:hypothetical protein